MEEGDGVALSAVGAGGTSIKSAINIVDSHRRRQRRRGGSLRGGHFACFKSLESKSGKIKLEKKRNRVNKDDSLAVVVRKITADGSDDDDECSQAEKGKPWMVKKSISLVVREVTKVPFLFVCAAKAEVCDAILGESHVEGETLSLCLDKFGLNSRKCFG